MQIGYTPTPRELSSYRSGGADGIRTHYLLTASQTLSRLSYSPVWFKNITEQLGKLKLEQPRQICSKNQPDVRKTRNLLGLGQMSTPNHRRTAFKPK
jgi:hypothetical protein